jgi:large subunit ribosomal protein L4e
MKATVYSLDGKKKKEIELPKIFASKIREDIVLKCLEAMKFKHPYSPAPEAGRRHSASGTISHKRHDWKGHYGRGISRTPRKTMWRRGTQFYWIGAEVSGTRGGRRAHGPEGIGKEKKINKKESEMAMNSAIASTGNEKYVLERYSTIEKLGTKLPLVVEFKENAKTKEALLGLKSILGDLGNVAVKKKAVRAGKGKLRGRKYKSNAGAIIVSGKDEKIKIKGFDVVPHDKLMISDLYPLGRVAIYTEKAIDEIGERK